MVKNTSPTQQFIDKMIDRAQLEHPGSEFSLIISRRVADQLQGIKPYYAPTEDAAVETIFGAYRGCEIYAQTGITPDDLVGLAGVAKHDDPRSQELPTYYGVVSTGILSTDITDHGVSQSDQDR